jgi:hypothetical protein
MMGLLLLATEVKVFDNRRRFRSFIYVTRCTSGCNFSIPTDFVPMKLTKEQDEKFRIAAKILEDNKKDTERFKDRTNGITNGDSERKKKAIAELLGK